MGRLVDLTYRLGAKAGVRRHPILTTPYSLRIGRHSLAVIVLYYILGSLVGAALIAFPLGVLHRPHWDFAYSYKVSFASLWSLGDILGEEDQPSGYYILAALASVAGILLPLFLLGSFVYKLLRHDPVRWRKIISVEDDHQRGTMLSVRFYPGTHSPLGDMRVRVFARVTYTKTHPRIANNRPMRVFYGGQLSDEIYIPYCSPGYPCTARVPLSLKRGAAATETEQSIDLQGEDVPKSSVEIIAIASGTIVHSGDSFLSVRKYNASNDLRAGQPQWIESIEGTDPKKWVGWNNFENNAELYIFVYGSLVSRNAMCRSIPDFPARDGPLPAVLSGWCRAWNVGSDPNGQRERVWSYSDGRPFRGVMASLGLRAVAGGECNGAVYRVSVKAMSIIDRRERDYHRINVTGKVRWNGMNDEAYVYTYVPTDEAQMLMRVAEREGTAVIAARYRQVIDEGFTALGPGELARYESSTPRFSGAIADISYSPANP